jgi:hypothetical protein
MPAILTNNLSVINAENFVDSFINGDSNIYMAVGRGYNEGDNVGDKTRDDYEKWTDESNPKTPVDTIAEQNDFRSAIIGIKRVQINNIMIMIPRIDWKEGAKFHPINTANKAGTRAQDYFCINSNNEVWMCIVSPEKNDEKKISGLTEKGSEPLLANGTPIDDKYEITTADGYTWRFMYNVTAAMVNSGMLLDQWMPVPFNKHGAYPGGMITANQDSFGDNNANRTLGAYRVLVTTTLKDEGDKIPYSAIYRQIGLIVDPLEIEDKNVTTPPARLTGDVYAADEFDLMSGELVYLENKSPIHREEGQNETLNLMLIF